MTPEQMYDFYADPANREPASTDKPIRRPARLSPPVTVRFSADELDAIKATAEADDCALSAWIRRACTRELARERASA
jgi:hypothetical protein